MRVIILIMILLLLSGCGQAQEQALEASNIIVKSCRETGGKLTYGFEQNSFGFSTAMVRCEKILKKEE